MGYATLRFSSVGSHQDAPAYIRLKFGEVAGEILEDSDEYEGWISRGWIQEEYLHIDVLPTEIHLPRRYAFRYLEIHTIATSRKWELVLDDVTLRAVSAVDESRIELVQTEDPMLERMDVVGLRTLKNCMQYEHAEIYYQYCTAIPVGALFAQTWNESLLEEVGQMIGQEMQFFHVSWWLAPGMNIHRNPLCGRNFEYYSEDPLVSGRIAAAITRGVQSMEGVGTTIKHFACNNQEDNRMSSDSILSQRALREIYLRGFEIAVKESQPMAIVTSYNLINGVHTANSKDLCTKVARQEWGFAGIIMTDWTTTTKKGGSQSWLCVQAGNDLIMPGSSEDYENIRRARRENRLKKEELKSCACRMIAAVIK